MTENASGTLDVSSGESNGEEVQNSSGVENDQKDFVSVESYRKVLAEKKRRDSELAELKAEREQLKMEKLQAEGNKDKLIDELKSRNAKLMEDFTNERTTNVFTRIEEQIKREAERQGCSNPDTLMRLIDNDAIVDLKDYVDEKYRVDPDALKSLIDKQKEAYADINLFGGKRINLNNPQGGKNFMPEKKEKSVNEMTSAEIEAKIKELDAQERADSLKR